MSQPTILVNGKLYDTKTGLPVETETVQPTAAAQPAARKVAPSHAVHRRIDTPRTANRRAPMIQKYSRSAPVTPKTAVPKKSASITKFAPHPVQPTKPVQVFSDVRPAPSHALAHKAQVKMAAAKAQPPRPMPKPADIIKKEAIDEALNKAPRHNTATPIQKKKRSPRVLSFASVALSLLLLAGYFTYVNLPNISVRVAAAQAGIDASYPSYRPDGYRLAGVNYDTGLVSLEFAANAGPQSYTLTQQQTSWDSTAVKENYVTPNWGDDVIPYSERGLTIYAHKSNAVWVNGGILYTISGDAPLSASQIRSIATNL